MPGGLINISSYGAANIILNGNPKKTFFKAVYKKYTNFGLQRFRLNFENQRNLSWNADTTYEFKIKRYAELIWDTYLVLNLPDIWSPLYPRPDIKNNNYPGLEDVDAIPYEFQWIENIGLEIIRRITIHSGGTTLAEYSGEYMSALVERDEGGKKILLSEMIGNEPRFNNPGVAYGRGGRYPNAVYAKNSNGDNCDNGIEPSIRGKKLYIPIMAWFCHNSKMALPLIALQYQDIYIKVELRPIRELFTIRNVLQPLEDNTTVSPPIRKLASNGRGDRKAPDGNSMHEQMWIFLQPPPEPVDGVNVNVAPFDGVNKVDNVVAPDFYPIKNNQWNSDIHLIGTYAFLGNKERRYFAAQDHEYLIRSSYQHDYHNSTGSKRIEIPSQNMVSSYMFRFRRSDVNLRNQWNNYTNWDWNKVLPSNIKGWDENTNRFVSTSSNNNSLNLFVTGCRDNRNIRDILIDMGVMMGGEYRENTQDSGIYNYIEKWIRTSGIAKDGLYIYSFAIDTHRTIYQPSGAQNMDKYQYVVFEFNTIEPPRNSNFLNEGNMNVLCDPSGNIIGIRKNLWNMNEYNYDLRIWEERYNMVQIKSGRIGLLFAR